MFFHLIFCLLSLFQVHAYNTFKIIIQTPWQRNLIIFVSVTKSVVFFNNYKKWTSMQTNGRIKKHIIKYSYLTLIHRSENIPASLIFNEFNFLEACWISPSENLIYLVRILVLHYFSYEILNSIVAPLRAIRWMGGCQINLLMYA